MSDSLDLKFQGYSCEPICPFLNRRTHKITLTVPLTFNFFTSNHNFYLPCGQHKAHSFQSLNITGSKSLLQTNPYIQGWIVQGWIVLTKNDHFVFKITKQKLKTERSFLKTKDKVGRFYFLKIINDRQQRPFVNDR